MVARALIAAAVLASLAGCGRNDDAPTDVRLLAPVALVGDTTGFERETRCRVDLRVYDEDEEIDAIARRRDVDVVARPTRGGERPHDAVELVRVALADGLEIVVPRDAANAFGRPTRPAGRRETRWEIRRDAPNPECARRWLAYATSQ